MKSCQSTIFFLVHCAILGHTIEISILDCKCGIFRRFYFSFKVWIIWLLKYTQNSQEKHNFLNS